MWDIGNVEDTFMFPFPIKYEQCAKNDFWSYFAVFQINVICDSLRSDRSPLRSIWELPAVGLLDVSVDVDAFVDSVKDEMVDPGIIIHA